MTLSTRRSPARRRRSAYPPPSPARRAPAPAPRLAQAERNAPPAAAPARCAPARASSRSSAPAPHCQGRGEVIHDPCPACRGAGRVAKERTLSVNIPAGIEDGTRIRLAGEGEAGLRGGPPGDLYIFLSIKPHEFFQRDGADIFCRVPMPMTTAALGGQFEVPTIDGGKTRVKIPEGTQTGKQFRLKGKGMPVLRPKPSATCTSRSRSRRRAEPHPPAARAAGGVREGLVSREQPRDHPASSPACRSFSKARAAEVQFRS